MIKLTEQIVSPFASIIHAPQIIVHYKDLLSGKDIQPVIEQAYGPKGLGILFVEGIPNYSNIRKATLPLFHKLATLPTEKLKKYEMPEIYYSKGWSCGV